MTFFNVKEAEKRSVVPGSGTRSEMLGLSFPGLFSMPVCV
jgi:hypothetical protein